ncbi:ABC transporter ATP-binding protein [Radiobacillus kanasensis]|uniref:ABC transporter ATP-binding protein n=1 Tax=Radiobacillus kanasensis TaxID=2844358 RepID=UPI001E5B615A|nr:ABC transporter ATP-binding protein [Radiobacillus kanasensis]UFT98331.1 ABC transporter ATP-binding protein [Radiobacillus kanasensis]
MGKPMIEFVDFGFKYRSQTKPTLHDINLIINQGEKVVIVGPSGSGKSTLAHCLNGLAPFSYKGDITGSLKINQKDVNKQGIFDRSKLIGTVLQDPDSQFIGLTVGEDIAFALENDEWNQSEMKSRVEEVAKLVDMDAYLDASVHELSGGQRQRVALGGVLVDDVDILLFDEPLANLDPAAGKQAITLIDSIQQEMNKTVIIIEHRLEDVLHEKVDRIIVMNHGSIVMDGTPAEVLSSSVLLENDIREPLYLKALKYAGCDVTPDMHPEHLDTLPIDSCKEDFELWFSSGQKRIEETISEPSLELKDISFGYSKDKVTIEQVSVQIGKGEMVSIVGKNGAGKSTLSKIIGGFEKPSQGRILLNGQDITNDTVKERSERIGMVLQNPNHMISKHMIMDEVAMGLKARGVPDTEIKERVEGTLKLCGLFPFRNWPISALSFGQKKRVTIASILVMEPEVLILDEPTAGQDYRHYTEMMEFLRELSQLGVTILMITHDMHLMLEYTPRAIVISDGKKLADDTAVNILMDQRIIELAHLKETSLFELALKMDIANPKEFVQHFIDVDREER